MIAAREISFRVVSAEDQALPRYLSKLNKLAQSNPSFQNARTVKVLDHVVSTGTEHILQRFYFTKSVVEHWPLIKARMRDEHGSRLDGARVKFLASAVRKAKTRQKEKNQGHLSLSLREAAERVGITPAELCEIENGRANPTLSRIVRIQKALGGRTRAWTPGFALKNPLPVWVEVIEMNGLPLLTDGKQAIQLTGRIDSAAACGAEAFGHRFWQALSKRERAIFAQIEAMAMKTGWTMIDAYRSWFQQWRIIGESGDAESR